MDLIISQCKNCNRNVHSFLPLEKSVLCPKCGQPSLEQVGKTTTSSIPKISVSAKRTKKEFLSMALDFMQKENVPDAVYDAIDPNRICKYLVPAYFYRGTIDAKWQCEYAGSSTITINGRKSEIKAGTPMNGEVLGYNFDAILLSPLQGSEEVWAERFDCAIPSSEAELNDYTIMNDAEALTLMPSTEPLKVWAEKGKDLCDYIAQSEAADSISDPFAMYAALGLMSKSDADRLSSSMGQHMGGNPPATRNWSIFSRSNIVEEPVDALVAVWYLPFEYNNETYYIAATADETANAICHLPSAPKSAENVKNENEEIKEAKKIANYIKLAGLLAIPLFFIANLIITLIFLVAWFVAFRYFDNQANKLKKAEDDAHTQKVNAEKQKVMSKLK